MQIMTIGKKGNGEESEELKHEILEDNFKGWRESEINRDGRD